MTTENTPDGQQTNVPDTPKTVEEAVELINHLRGINQEVIKSRDETKQKLRKFEVEQEEKSQALMQEQGKFKELYESTSQQLVRLQETLRVKAVDSALKDVVQKAGARSVDTVSKLIDKSKINVGDDYNVDGTSILSQIEELKKTDPILFGIGEGANLPPVKRPSGGESTSGFEQEIRAAKSQTEIMSVMKKYGKI